MDSGYIIYTNVVYIIIYMTNIYIIKNIYLLLISKQYIKNNNLIIEEKT